MELGLVVDQRLTGPRHSPDPPPTGSLAQVHLSPLSGGRVDVLLGPRSTQRNPMNGVPQQQPRFSSSDERLPGGGGSLGMRALNAETSARVPPGDGETARASTCSSVLGLGCASGRRIAGLSK